MTRAQSRNATSKICVAETGPTVSILVAARNNARYLKEAIQSAIDQTIKCEVVYSDDCSTDNSLAIADSFGDRILVLRSHQHRGVCFARNKAVAASHGTHLVHLDGDDILTPTFVADHLAVFRSGTPYAYGPAQAFGEGPRAGIFWDVPKSWQETNLWNGNSVNTSAMYARWAFMAAGEWQDGVGTMWDWDLALRAARLGTPEPSRAVLNYRQHPASWSHQLGEFTDAVRCSLQAQVRKRLATVSVGCVLGGRLGGNFAVTWLEHLATSVSRLKIPVDLSVICTGAVKASSFSRMASRYEYIFPVVRAVDVPFRLEFGNENERREKVSRMLAANHNRLREMMSGDIHWMVEDDILVASDTGVALRDVLTAGNWETPAAVTSLYRNRHVPEEYVCGHRNKEIHHHLRTPPDSVSPIDFCGTGCLMFWKHSTPRVWNPLLGTTPAHDWEWCHQLAASGRKLLVAPIACGHARSADDIIH